MTNKDTAPLPIVERQSWFHYVVIGGLFARTTLAINVFALGAIFGVWYGLDYMAQPWVKSNIVGAAMMMIIPSVAYFIASLPEMDRREKKWEAVNGKH
jgi:hypothetical protein